jgi:hypothetical protein
MTDNNVKFKSAGKAQPFSTTVQAAEPNKSESQGNEEGGGEGQEGAGGNEGNDGSEGANTGGQGQAGGGTSESQNEGDIGDDVLIASFNKRTGKEIKTIDELNALLNPSSGETDEQKTQKEKALEKKMMDRFLAEGGKVEDFVSLKKILEVDLTQLSVSAIKEEMKSGGFSEEEIDAVLKERYYQMEDEDIDSISDEAEKAFAKKKKEFGSKKLNGKGEFLKTQAGSALNKLREAIEAEEADIKLEETFSSNVDEHFKKIPRKMTFELGQSNDETLAPVEVDVTDEEVEEAVSLLKDPAKRNQYFFNEDGETLNISNVSSLLLRNKVLEKALKLSHLKGADKEVQKFKAQFGSDPRDIGLGGGTQKNGQNQKGGGKLASYGKPQPVR